MIEKSIRRDWKLGMSLEEDASPDFMINISRYVGSTVTKMVADMLVVGVAPAAGSIRLRGRLLLGYRPGLRSRQSECRDFDR